MNARPTLPVPEWDVPNPKGDGWDYPPQENVIEAAQNPVDKALVHRQINKRIPATSVLSGRVFQGRLNVSDLDYMAKAIMQLCDENYELRERVRRLEKRLGLE